MAHRIGAAQKDAFQGHRLGDHGLLCQRLCPLLVRAGILQSTSLHIHELVAQVLPLFAMQDMIHCFIIMFVDNEPARLALSKGFGKDESINSACFSTVGDTLRRGRCAPPGSESLLQPTSATP